MLRELRNSRLLRNVGKSYFEWSWYMCIIRCAAISIVLYSMKRRRTAWIGVIV